MPRRVAVIFPEADCLAVEQFRDRWDPLAQRVAAHVTLAYPFDDDRDDSLLAEEVAASIADVAAFSLRLDIRSGGGDDHYVFLLPSVGREGIEQLHARLYDGPLRDVPRPLSFAPHMTVGRCGSGQEAVAAVRDAEAIGLSLTGVAAAVSVYEIKRDGPRVPRFRLALA